MSAIRQVFNRDGLPGYDLLTTETAREIAERPQFTNGISSHVYVNGHDLARVEAEAVERYVASKRRPVALTPAVPEASVTGGTE